MATRDEFKGCKNPFAVHTKLQSILCTGYLVAGNLNTFRMNCRLYLRQTNQKLLRTAWDIWDELEKQKYIKENEYGTLKELLDGIDIAMIDLIREAEDKIKTLGTSQGDHGIKRKRESADENKDFDEKPGTSRSGKSSSIPEVPKDAKYPMGEKKGSVIIFNNWKVSELPELEGYKEDARNLEEFFSKKLQYDVDVEENQSKKDIYKELGHRQKHDYNDVGVFICIFLSHGNIDTHVINDGGQPVTMEESFIYSADAEKIYIKRVIDMFSNKDKCKSLVDKPKIFIIQACRGDETNTGDRVRAGGNPFQSRSPEIIPNHSDVLLFNCTVSGYSCSVDQDGSVFMKSFCEQMKSHLGADFLSICTYVINDVAEDGSKSEKQIPEIKSTLRKFLYL